LGTGGAVFTAGFDGGATLVVKGAFVGLADRASGA